MACGLIWLLTGLACADTFQLGDGQVFTGEIVSPDEKGVRIRLPEGGYAEIKLPDGTLTQVVPWAKFSQADLKKIASNPKAAQFVEPFIEVPPEEKAKEREITVKPVPRLEQPQAGSLLGALFSSSVGLAVLFLGDKLGVRQAVLIGAILLLVVPYDWTMYNVVIWRKKSSSQER